MLHRNSAGKARILRILRILRFLHENDEGVMIVR